MDFVNFILRRSLVRLATLLFLCGIILIFSNQSSSTAPNSTSKLPNTDTLTTSAGATSHTNKSVASSIQTAPQCHAGDYIKPFQPNVSTSSPGLHQKIGDPEFYTVFGNTPSEINNQIFSCTPVNDLGEKFAASTDYSIAWTFNYQDDGTGMCHITGASVGINVVTVFPKWQPTPGTQKGTSDSWQRFISNLATHENGHTQLDIKAAQQILTDIQNYPTIACSNMEKSVNGRASLDLALLQQANNDYDIKTDHGTTQGAVLR